MLQALRTFGRILATHWPALAAWYLGGEALHQLLILLAGFVGGHTSLGGLLLLPLAVAARLISYVAMYLTVRSSLPHSGPDAPKGMRQFAGALLVAILPFFAFYASWGMLTADQNEFFQIATAIAIPESGYSFEALGDRGGLISVGPLPVAVLVIALAARLLLSRFRERLPAWTLAVAAYAEVLWTFMLFTLVAQWWMRAKDWIAEREGVVWLEGIGDWFAEHVLPVAAIWEGMLWLSGIFAAVILVPAAWLTVAGVIYGTTFDSAPPFQTRDAASQGSMKRLRQVVLARFEALWAAVALIWRGGPLLFGATALAYALWQFAERLGSRGALQIFGGRESDFWEAFLPLILIGVAVIAEPLRVALVATAFDSVVGRPQAGLSAGTAGAGTTGSAAAGAPAAGTAAAAGAAAAGAPGAGAPAVGSSAVGTSAAATPAGAAGTADDGELTGDHHFPEEVASGLDGEAVDVLVGADDVEPERSLGVFGKQEDGQDVVSS